MTPSASWSIAGLVGRGAASRRSRWPSARRPRPCRRRSANPGWRPSSPARTRAAARRHLVGHEKHRHLGRGGRVAPRDGGLQQVMCGLGRSMIAQPFRQADAVVLLGGLGSPRRLEGNRPADPLQLEHGRPEVRRRPRAHRPRDGAAVAVLLAADDHHRLAVGVLLVAWYAEFLHQTVDAVLTGPDPGPAAVDPRTVVAILGERFAADAVARLQQRHRMTRLLQPQGGRQPRETRPHHAEINVRP